MPHPSSSASFRSCLRGALGLTGLVATLAAVGLLASGAQAESVVGGWAPSDLIGQYGFPHAPYYRVTRPDLRLCPSPLCGGVFVEKVNRRRLKCADGTRAKECHAAIVDFSALGLSPAEEARLQADFVAQRVLVRGDLELVDLGIGIDVPTLTVTDAWRGVTGTQANRGHYFGVFSTGIVCITYPCPSFAAFKLNGRRVGWLHSIDFDATGATPEQIALGTDALYSGPGLIAFAMWRTIEGPAGIGKSLRMTEFYTRVDGGGPVVCGGYTYPPNPSCDSGEFCEPPPNTCYIADVPGTCQPVPEACITLYDPVCGCNGVTYGNDCERQMARVALDHVGACTP